MSDSWLQRLRAWRRAIASLLTAALLLPTALAFSPERARADIDSLVSQSLCSLAHAGDGTAGDHRDQDHQQQCPLCALGCLLCCLTAVAPPDTASALAVSQALGAGAVPVAPDAHHIGRPRQGTSPRGPPLLS